MNAQIVELKKKAKEIEACGTAMFYWQGEDVTDATALMHFEMSKRAYEQMLALMAGSDLRARPSQASK